MVKTLTALPLAEERMIVCEEELLCGDDHLCGEKGGLIPLDADTLDVEGT